MNPKEREIKSKLRLDINRTLLAIGFTIFALIISLNPSLFKESFLVPMQLTISIPLLLSSIFARSRLAYTKKPKLWEEYGFLTFLIGYAFLINVIGILLSIFINLTIGLIFIFFNILSAIVYSIFEISEDKSKLSSRIKKDLLFIILLLVGGILPSLGIF